MEPFSKHTLLKLNESIFITSISIILIISAYLKYHSLHGENTGLALKDPVLKIDMPLFMTISTAAEILVTLTMSLRIQTIYKLFILRGLLLSFLFYHIARFMIGSSFCPCMGLLAPELLGGSETYSWLITSLVIALASTNELLIFKQNDKINHKT